MQACAEAVTILRELGGADQSGDLEGVLADGAVGQVLDALPSGRIAFFLQLQLCGRKVQVKRQILQFLRFSLFFRVTFNQHIRNLEALIIWICNNWNQDVFFLSCSMTKHYNAVVFKGSWCIPSIELFLTGCIRISGKLIDSKKNTAGIITVMVLIVK